MNIDAYNVREVPYIKGELCKCEKGFIKLTFYTNKKI